VSRYDDARRHLEAALELADSLDGCPQATYGRRDLGELLERLADHQGALRTHREAAELAAAGGDALEEARARLGLAGVLMRQRRLREAHEHATACVDLIPADGHELVELEAVHTLAQIDVRRNDVDHARPLLKRAFELARRVGSRNREIAVISTLGHLSYRSGDFLEAYGQLERALELASELGDRDDLPHLRINAALCLDYLGRKQEAQEVIERALAEATAMGHETARIRAQARLGEILLGRGHLEQALVELGAVHKEATRVGDAAADSASARALARVLSCLGEFEEASAVLDGWLARVRSRSRDTPNVSIYALAIRGQLLEHADRRDEAIALYEQAWARRQREDSPVPTDALLLGRACWRAGRNGRAREVLQAALELSRRGKTSADETMASVYLAALPNGDLLTARLLLERHEAALSLPGRVDANFVLWQASGEAEHLLAAKQHLDRLLANSPRRYRESMRKKVALYRHVQEAWLTYERSIRAT
jgi:tetratricopeptide (TPR) repeat protein